MQLRNECTPQNLSLRADCQRLELFKLVAKNEFGTSPLSEIVEEKNLTGQYSQLQCYSILASFKLICGVRSH